MTLLRFRPRRRTTPIGTRLDIYVVHAFIVQRWGYRRGLGKWPISQLEEKK